LIDAATRNLVAQRVEQAQRLLEELHALNPALEGVFRSRFKALGQVGDLGPTWRDLCAAGHALLMGRDGLKFVDPWREWRLRELYAGLAPDEIAQHEGITRADVVRLMSSSASEVGNVESAARE